MKPRSTLGPIFLAVAVVLAPGLAAGGGEPPAIIDLHTHVFNAHDVPIAGIMRAQAMPIRIFGPVLEFIAAFASDYAPESSRPRNFSPQDLARINALSEADKDAIYTFLGRERLQSLRPLAAAAPLALDDGRQLDPESVALCEAVFAQANFPPAEDASRVTDRPGAAARPLTVDIGSGLSFVRLMMRSQKAIAESYRQTYPQVNLAVHHMMDLAITYDDAPKNEFSLQIRRMDALEAEPTLAGHLVHFVAFNPYRGDPALAMIRSSPDGPLRGRALGVKFYPPSGYRAALNDIEPEPEPSDYWRHAQWTARYAGLGGDMAQRNAKLDQLADQLFSYCEKFDLPVFTHCTGLGAQAVPGYGMNSDPRYWRKALEAHPKLRLCFGHSGGEPWWFNPGPAPPGNWPDDEKTRWSFGQQVVDLCQEFENVYCEVGYLDAALTKGPKRDQFVGRLKAVLRQPAQPGRWAVAHKLIYGTDWHMIKKEREHPGYLRSFEEIFDDPELRPYRTRFFATNAIDFLRLAAAARDPRFTAAQQTAFQELIARTNSTP